MRNLVALVIVLFSSKADALTCLIPPIEDRYRESSHVALVEVVGARIEQSKNHSTEVPRTASDSLDVEIAAERLEPRWRRVVATVKVLESYKGEDTPTELVLTSWGERPEIAVGATYLVYLDGPTVSLDCQGMPMISTTDPEHLRVLEELRALKGPTSRHVPATHVDVGEIPAECPITVKVSDDFQVPEHWTVTPEQAVALASAAGLAKCNSPFLQVVYASAEAYHIVKPAFGAVDSTARAIVVDGITGKVQVREPASGQ